MIIDLTAISQWCIAFTAILIFLKWVSAPVKNVLDNNKHAMQALQEAINKLSDGLKENQYNFQTSKMHTEQLQKVQDQHEVRIGTVEDRLISHDEQLKTLWKTKEDKN